MDSEAAMTPLLLPPSPDERVGHAAVDAQHEALHALCGLLADCATARPGAGCEDAFDTVLAEFKALVRTHLDTEGALLARGPETAVEVLDALEAEREEFETLADDVMTPACFDRVELQRYAALWTVGHIRSCAARWRAASGADRAAERR